MCRSPGGTKYDQAVKLRLASRTIFGGLAAIELRLLDWDQVKIKFKAIWQAQ